MASVQEIFELPGCGHVRCYTEALACAMENFRDAHPDSGWRLATPALMDAWARLYILTGLISCRER